MTTDCEKHVQNAAAGDVAGDDRPLTEGRFKYYLESIKGLIVSTARGTEVALRKEIHDVRVRVDRCEVAISGHSKEIQRLDVKIDGVRTELAGKIDGVRTELKEDHASLRTELLGEMRGMERRLSEKIDGHSARLDNHESRISSLEHQP